MFLDVPLYVTVDRLRQLVPTDLVDPIGLDSTALWRCREDVGEPSATKLAAPSKRRKQ